MANFRRLTKAAKRNRFEEAFGLLPVDDAELWRWIDELRDAQDHMVALPVLEYATGRVNRPFLDQVIGWFYCQSGNHDKAASAFGRAIRAPDVLKQEGLYAAWLHNAADLPEIALDILDRLKSVVPMNSAFILTRADALAKTGSASEALQMVRQVADANDGVASPADIVASYMACKSFGEADEYVRNIPMPTSLDPVINLAVARMEAGEEREAEELLRIVPASHRTARYLYASARLSGLRDRYEESLAEIRRSLELDPHDSSARKWEAYVLGQLRRFGEAEAILRGVLKLRPYDPAARKLIAEVELEIQRQ